LARSPRTTTADEVLHAAGGPAWSDPALTDRERGIAIITALAAQGVTDDRLATHIRLAQHNGLDHDALTALMILLAGYLGYPRASLTMETINNLDLPPNTPRP
jgi:4-carboxymuconolactone decarboxylase